MNKKNVIILSSLLLVLVVGVTTFYAIQGSKAEENPFLVAENNHDDDNPLASKQNEKPQETKANEEPSEPDTPVSSQQQQLTDKAASGVTGTASKAEPANTGTEQSKTLPTKTSVKEQPKQTTTTPAKKTQPVKEQPKQTQPPKQEAPKKEQPRQEQPKSDPDDPYAQFEFDSTPKEEVDMVLEKEYDCSGPEGCVEVKG